MSGVREVKVIVPTKTVLVKHAKTYAPAELLLDALNAAHLRASVADVDYYDEKNTKGGRGDIKTANDDSQPTRAENFSSVFLHNRQFVAIR